MRGQAPAGWEDAGPALLRRGPGGETPPAEAGERGAALVTEGRFAEAVPLLRRAAEMEPAADWRNLLGVALCQAGDLAGAEAAFRQARQEAADSLIATLNLVDLYRIQRRPLEAIDLLQEALHLMPGEPEVLIAFGLLCCDLDERQGIRAALEQLAPLGGGGPLAALEAASPADEPAQLRAALYRIWAARMDALAPRARAGRLASELRRQAVPPRVWAADEIALFCLQRWETWSPRSLARGIGGSEEAVIQLSAALARLGWKVTVYGNPGAEAGEYGGVTYRSYYGFNPADRFNILVGWRGVSFFTTGYRAKGTYLWLHDVPNADRFTPERLRHVTRVLVLSEYHRRTLPALPDETFMVTGNGIDVGQVEEIAGHTIARRPQRCIYTSSYDRGLETLLLIWPEVRRAVPQAELHVCYGWDTADAMRVGDAAYREWKGAMGRLLAQPGVCHQGRLGHTQVLVETFRSGIWAYPTVFPEISCITAMKCQAAGAIPVTSDWGALRETVGFGVKLPVAPGYFHSAEGRAAYRDALIRALRDETWQADVRREMMPWARQRFAWAGVARQWDEEFTRRLRQAR